LLTAAAQGRICAGHLGSWPWPGRCDPMAFPSDSVTSNAGHMIVFDNRTEG